MKAWICQQEQSYYFILREDDSILHMNNKMLYNTIEECFSVLSADEENYVLLI